MITEFKSVERRIRFRTCNKTMPRRRIDIPAGAVDMCNPEFLSKFTSETGKILPRRITGTSLKYQRRVAQAVKRARHLALLPFVTDMMK